MRTLTWHRAHLHTHNFSQRQRKKFARNHVNFSKEAVMFQLLLLILILLQSDRVNLQMVKFFSKLASNVLKWIQKEFHRTHLIQFLLVRIFVMPTVHVYNSLLGWKAIISIDVTYTKQMIVLLILLEILTFMHHMRF